ncbi:MAG: hypothetical protein R3E97_08260 [Candidatus Eisenbacteria bacterium]
MIPNRDAGLERSLGSLRGVRSVRIEREPEGMLQVFVVAEDQSTPESIVAQVRTLVRAEKGEDLLPSNVHVAQVVPARSERIRLVFRSVHIYREGQRAEAQVELFEGDRSRVGRAEGVAVRGGLIRLVALATLDAVGPAFGRDVAIDLAAAQRKRIGGRSFVLCHLVLVRGREEQHLSGSVLVTSDPLEATVFAVLDALNRVLPEKAVEEEIEYEVEDIVPLHREGAWE